MAENIGTIRTVADAISGSVLGTTGLATERLFQAATAACQTVDDYAPLAPSSIKLEAAIRFAGWMIGSRPHATRTKTTDPSNTSLEVDQAAQATVNGLRASGASAMLSRYVRRRAGVIGGTAPAAPEPDLGTTVMRCGFSDVIPHRQSTWRWAGTVNSVELDSTFPQPSSFAFWLPGDVMLYVIAVELLRSVSPGTPGDPVTLAAFGLPEQYTFGATDGMIRYTPVTFTGQFSWPNDFRAILRTT